MGSIHARGKKNRLYVYFTYKSIRRHEKTNYFCETGKQDCKCRNCRAAIALVGEIERKINDDIFKYADYFPNSRTLEKLHEYSLKTDITFGTYATQWIESTKPSLAKSTAVSYDSMLDMLIDHFGKFQIRDIRPGHVKAYVASLSVKPKTIRNRIGLLSTILGSAIDDELIDKNPCQRVKLPAIQQEPVDAFEWKEVNSILEWLKKNKPNMATFFAIGFYTGMREGEIMGLKWSDIDFNDYTITIQRTISSNEIKDRTKTNKIRTIDIPEELDDFLTEQKARTFLHSEFVFVNYKNEPFTSYTTITDYYWKPCLKALGMRYRIAYQMRHTFACLMIEKGEDLNWIKNTLGHSSLKMLFEKYGNKIERRQAKGQRKKFGAVFGAEQTSL